MALRSMLFVLLFVLAQVCSVLCIRIQELYPSDDISSSSGSSKVLTNSVSSPVTLRTTYNLYGKPYRRLRVYTNGLISLGNNPIRVSPRKYRKFLFPTDVKVIAPFYAPGGVAHGGRVSYRETQHASTLSRATADVRHSFTNEQDFNATAIFIVTWDQLKHAHHTQDKKNNTFQAVLITDGAKTFVQFNYALRGLQWTKGYHVYWEGKKLTHAQAGFSAGDFVRYYTLPGSGTEDAYLLTRTSNMVRTGQWMFKVGWPDMHGLEVQSADSYQILTTPYMDFAAGQYFEGCFVVHGYLTANRSQVWQNVGIRSCMALCHQRGQNYAALHNGSQCACLSNVRHLVEAETDQQCNIPCTTDETELCGGRTTASVYQAVASAALLSDQSADERQEKDVDECAEGQASCDVNATCINTSPGYCCRCNKGFHGNGITCLKIGAVQRMVGFLSGTINGQKFGKLSMDTIAFSDDGRAYVSVRSFPASLAYSARLLTPLTDVVGWLYAKRKSSHFHNGHSLVGERFVRRATVRFDTGEELAIHQNYQGRDPRTRYIRVDTTLAGVIPIIHPKATVNMKTFRQEFKRTRPGRMQSRGTVKYQVDGREHYFTVDQFIDYNELAGCGHHVDRGVLEADVLSISYDSARDFLAIAVRATYINATLDSIDMAHNQEPLAKTCGSKRVTCHKLGVCISYNGDRECRCNHGYFGDGLTYCKEADECKLGRYRCSKDAKCVNSVGSYKCICNTGFLGDGKNCKQDSRVVCPKPCHSNGRCIQVRLGVKCVCNPGYIGDGFQCKPDGKCSGRKCHVNAKCLSSNDKSQKCVCNTGYQGDGQTCTARVGECGGVFCSKQAQCVLSKCRCNLGYQGNGQNCSDENECDLKSDRCDLNADCTNTAGSYRCQCRPGYTGNGLRCQKISISCGGETCHRFASCEADPVTNRQKCQCRLGFRGNGMECLDFDECVPALSTCDVNAECRNTLGSYECICKRGFVQDKGKCVVDDKCNGIRCHAQARCDVIQGCQCKSGFAGDGKQCDDVDECKSQMNRCDPNAVCLNTAGSFACRCRAGFEGDGFRCRMDDTCSGRVCDVNGRCEGPGGRTRRCVCNNGWQGNGTSCDDVDECRSSQFSCQLNADCVNSEGSYECRCKPGFVENGSSCAEDNTCNGVICDPNAVCLQKTQGDRQCVCNSGLIKDGNKCRDRDECSSIPCHRHAHCINSFGSYTCRCKPGNQGDGRHCDDINECEASQPRCPPTSLCINKEGSYECRCRLGFSKNGSACVVDTTCNGVLCDSNAKCVQSLQGVRVCVCDAGWDKDGAQCRDRDECRSVNPPCHPKADCTNSPGSFSCRCRPGYEGDGRACEAWCRPGYEGDGRACEADGTCAGVICHPDAACRQNTAEGTNCVCEPGYLGDGRKCADIDECSQGKDRCDKHAACINTVGSYKCSCNLGYYGDGFNCTNDGSCQGFTCDPNAKCVASSPTGQNKSCDCNDGFTGNGLTCRDQDECSLGHAKCHHKAECVNQVGSYRCRCIRGYVGDGLHCESDGTCEGKVCDFNAMCIKTNSSKGVDKMCRCKAGFEGDGIICTDMDECVEDPCPKMSKCTNAFGSFMCQCKPGYKKSNDICEKICYRCMNGASCVGENECQCPKGFSGKQCQWYGEASLIYTKGNSVQRMSLPPRSSAIGLVYQQDGLVNVGIDYDCVDEYIYWTEVMEGCIMRAKYDGTGREVVFEKSQVRSPEGLAVDWMGRNLYWTDTGLDVIEVSRLNGTNRRVLISNGLDDPRAILVDPLSGKMYWSDWTRRRPRIEVANMDGSNRRVLVHHDLGLPNGLTLVQTTNELCYTDAGSWSIRCVDLGSLNVRKVLSRISYPFGISNFNRTLYWTNWNHNLVHRIGVYSTSPDTPLATFAGGNGKIFDVKAVQPCPAKAPKNPCAVSNGGCSGLCLLKANGYSCLCPKGQFPVTNGNTTTCKGECNGALGMENGLISDAQLFASSSLNNNPKRHGPHRARLNLATWPAGWNSKKYESKPWLQVDLGSVKMVTAAATQGFGQSNIAEWVKTYKVASSDDGVRWTVLEDRGREKIFVGNSDQMTVTKNVFPTFIKTRWLRILPRTWHNHVSMRVELYGC